MLFVLRAVFLNLLVKPGGVCWTDVLGTTSNWFDAGTPSLPLFRGKKPGDSSSDSSSTQGAGVSGMLGKTGW